jgi:hypothetical protein
VTLQATNGHQDQEAASHQGINVSLLTIHSTRDISYRAHGRRRLVSVCANLDLKSLRAAELQLCPRSQKDDGGLR